jgi:hypothetical protein
MSKIFVSCNFKINLDRYVAPKFKILEGGRGSKSIEA